MILITSIYGEPRYMLGSLLSTFLDYSFNNSVLFNLLQPPAISVFNLQMQNLVLRGTVQLRRSPSQEITCRLLITTKAPELELNVSIKLRWSRGQSRRRPEEIFSVILSLFQAPSCLYWPSCLLDTKVIANPGELKHSKIPLLDALNSSTRKELFQ